MKKLVRAQAVNDRIRFFLKRLGERLWVKPLIYSVLSIVAAWLARLADLFEIADFFPAVSFDTIETLLTIISSSMLVIATFAVGSMVSSYASVSSVATPRSLSLVIADDVSQNALSSFLGAFIFSIVALVSLQGGLYGDAGKFVLLCLTLLVFAAVILTFVRWVDSIARLGRLGTAMEKVEVATAKALQQLRLAPTRRGAPVIETDVESTVLYADKIGYVQRVDVEMLQRCASQIGLRIQVTALPGAFTSPDRPLAQITSDSANLDDLDTSSLKAAFIIGKNRTFDEDPRMGLTTLGEIASRALSPAINDPGTAIEVLACLVRLFSDWTKPLKEGEAAECEFDLVSLPEISVSEMFGDAFGPIARDGAGAIDVALRLQEALKSLALNENPKIRSAALNQARLALARSEIAMQFPNDLVELRKASVAHTLQP